MSTSHTTYSSQAEFAANQPREGSPETQFRQRPDRRFERDFFNGRLRFPDGSHHEMWSFKDESGERHFPAPLIRVREGEIVHVELKPGKGPHTLHWHGIEPDPRNDGVGHTSFEVTGGYTYQWRPEPGVPGDPNHGAAGTYFYHCHVNTVLHVQLGMVGPVIIDPVVHPAYPEAPGARRAFVDGPLYDLETETALFAYSLDPRWHDLQHAAGLSGEDVGLNRFDPTHFFVLGGPLVTGPTEEGVWSLDEVRARAPGSGHPTLLRTANLNYFPVIARLTTTEGVPLRMAELIGHDGRAYRDTSDPTGPCPPTRDRGNRLMTSTFAFGSAERYDVLLHPPRAGTYLLHIDWLHWSRREVLATRTIPVVAT